MKTFLGNTWFEARVEETRAFGPAEILYTKGIQAVRGKTEPYSDGCGLMVDIDDLKNSVHGHDTGMRHTGCGGEVYYDWSVTYECDGETIPSLRCTVCKKEMAGDADITLPREEGQ